MKDLKIRSIVKSGKRQNWHGKNRENWKQATNFGQLSLLYMHGIDMMWRKELVTDWVPCYFRAGLWALWPQTDVPKTLHTTNFKWIQITLDHKMRKQIKCESTLLYISRKYTWRTWIATNAQPTILFLHSIIQSNLFIYISTTLNHTLHSCHFATFFIDKIGTIH